MPPTWSEEGQAYTSDLDTDAMGSSDLDVENEDEWLFKRGMYDSASSDGGAGLPAAFELFNL